MYDVCPEIVGDEDIAYAIYSDTYRPTQAGVDDYLGGGKRWGGAQNAITYGVNHK